MSYITCHVSHVTFHLSLKPTAANRPLLIHPLSTLDWFQVKKNPNYLWTKNNVNIVVTFEQILQFYVLVDLESL